MENEFVTTDSKGRVLIPVEIREKFHTNRFIVREHRGELILKPVKKPEQLLGLWKNKKVPKFRHIGKGHSF